MYRSCLKTSCLSITVWCRLCYSHLHWPHQPGQNLPLTLYSHVGLIRLPPSINCPKLQYIHTHTHLDQTCVSCFFFGQAHQGNMITHYINKKILHLFLSLFWQGNGASHSPLLKHYKCPPTNAFTTTMTTTFFAVQQ